MISKNRKPIDKNLTKEDLVAFAQRLQAGLYPTERAIQQLVQCSIEVLQKRLIYYDVSPPVAVVGSLHGCFEDLMQIFQWAGDPPLVQYIFLGNYVDKGSHSLFVFLYLLCLKCLYPADIHLLRGAHESVSMNKIFGFFDECLAEYASDKVYLSICQVYPYLPVIVRIDPKADLKILCVHSGISPILDHLSTLFKIPRSPDVKIESKVRSAFSNGQQDYDSMLADILWADPNPKTGEGVLPWDFSENSFSYMFSEEKTKQFLVNNKLKLMIRGHDLVPEGILYQHNRMIITVFSAVNFGSDPKNFGGFLMINEHGEIEQFILKEKIEGGPREPKLSDDPIADGII